MAGPLGKPLCSVETASVHLKSRVGASRHLLSHSTWKSFTLQAVLSHPVYGSHTINKRTHFTTEMILSASLRECGSLRWVKYSHRCLLFPAFMVQGPSVNVKSAWRWWGRNNEKETCDVPCLFVCLLIFAVALRTPLKIHFGHLYSERWCGFCALQQRRHVFRKDCDSRLMTLCIIVQIGTLLRVKGGAVI